MTLDTKVYALTEIDPHELFAKCRELIGAEDRHPWRMDTDRIWTIYSPSEC